MTVATPPHLEKTVSDRGLEYLPHVPSSYGGDVAVYTSSNASGPHVWLRAIAPADLNRPDGPTVEAPMHLTAANAVRLAEQLLVSVMDHYQLHGHDWTTLPESLRVLCQELLAATAEYEEDRNGEDL